MIDLGVFEAAALRKMLRVGKGAEWLSCSLPIIGPGKELRLFRLCTNWHMEASLFSQVVNLTSPCAASYLTRLVLFFIPRVLVGSTSPHPANNPHRDHPSSFSNIALLSPIPGQPEAEAEMIDFDRRDRLNCQLSQKPLPLALGTDQVIRSCCAFWPQYIQRKQ